MKRNKEKPSAEEWVVVPVRLYRKQYEKVRAKGQIAPVIRNLIEKMK